MKRRLPVWMQTLTGSAQPSLKRHSVEPIFSSTSSTNVDQVEVESATEENASPPSHNDGCSVGRSQPVPTILSPSQINRQYDQQTDVIENQPNNEGQENVCPPVADDSTNTNHHGEMNIFELIAGSSSIEPPRTRTPPATHSEPPPAEVEPIVNDVPIKIEAIKEEVKPDITAIKVEPTAEPLVSSPPTTTVPLRVSCNYGVRCYR